MKTLKQLLIDNDFTSTDLTLSIVKEWLEQKCPKKEMYSEAEFWVCQFIDELLEELKE